MPTYPGEANPFLEDAKKKGLIPTNGTTGNEFLDSAYPHAGRDYDSLPFGIMKQSIKSLLSPVTGLFSVLDSRGHNPVADELNTALTPNFAPDDPTKIKPTSRSGLHFVPPGHSLNPTADSNLESQEGKQFLADLAGEGAGLVSTTAAFKTVSTTLEVAAQLVPSVISSRVLSGVAKLSASIAQHSKQLGLSTDVANAIGGTVMSAPKNIAAGVALDVATNPDANSKSMATNAALSGVFSILDGIGYAQRAKLLYPNMVANYNQFMVLAGKTKPISKNPDFMDRVLDNIAEDPGRNTDPPRSIADLYSAVVHGKYGFKRLEKQLPGGKVAANESAYNQAELSNGIPASIEAFTESPHTIDPNGNKVVALIPGTQIPVPGIKTIMEPIDSPELKNALDSYLVSKHVVDKAMLGTQRKTVTHPQTKEQATIVSTAMGEHIIDYPTSTATFPTLADAESDLASNGYVGNVAIGRNRQVKTVTDGISVIDATKTIHHIEQNFPQVVQAANELRLVNNVLIDYAQQSGLLTERGLRMFQTLADQHISLKTIMEGDVPKAIPGSYSILDNIGLVIRASIKNKVKMKLADLADNFPNESKDWAVKDRGVDIKETPLWGEINKTMQNLGKHVLDLKLDKQGVIELVSGLGSHAVPKIDDNWSSMLFYRNGYIQKYKVNSILQEALSTLTPEQTHGFARILGLPARALVTGVTSNPVFGFVQASLDSFEATLGSKYGFKFGYDSWRGFLEGVGKGKYKGQMLSEMNAVGGGYGTIIHAKDQLTTARLGRSVLPMTFGEKVGSGLLHPIEVLQRLTRPMLEAARIGEYMKAREAGASMIEAATHSRHFIGDYGMKGSSPVVQAFSHMAAFMNPAIQSLDSELRNLAKRPGAIAIKGVGLISVPTLFFYAAGKNDKEIQQLRKTPEGGQYWFFRLGETIYKWPKPYVYGHIFGTLLEAGLDKAFDNDPESGQRWVDSILQQAKIAVIPTSVAIGMNINANKDSFSGRPIIPPNLEGIDPEYQETPTTTNAAKAMSVVINNATLGKYKVSPIMMDYIIRQTTGTLGKTAAHATGNLGNIATDTEDFPFLSRVIAKYPSYAVEPIQTFYKNAQEADEVVQTANRLYNTNQLDKFTGYITKNTNKFALAPIYSETKAQLNELRTALLMVENDKDISPETKKEMADYIIKQSIEITNAINNTVRHIRE